ncbi:DUF6795 domain-containing protein [Roseibium sp.]|uniref:DUF6795 domain-containing protein n=1 Tax=Roseibium sp. TaxID=1936156 RepID=UPI003262DD0C
MALFGTNVLFSEVSGTVVLDGKPVEGARVVQITLWSKPGAVPENTVTTDKNGQFSFPEISRSAGFSNLVPGEITIVQKINIEFDGKEYRGWLNTKTNYEREGERNRPLRFICDLNHTPSNTGDDFGVCRLA